LRILERGTDDVTLRVAYRVMWPWVMEVDARFHSPNPRTIVMTIVRGEGVGSVVETHATPLGGDRTAITELTVASTDRIGLAVVRMLQPLARPVIEYAAHKLWVEDAAYAERLYALRRGEHREPTRLTLASSRPTAAVSSSDTSTPSAEDERDLVQPPR
jgi:isorenieratene synthase